MLDDTVTLGLFERTGTTEKLAREIESAISHHNSLRLDAFMIHLNSENVVLPVSSTELANLMNQIVANKVSGVFVMNDLNDNGSEVIRPDL